MKVDLKQPFPTEWLEKPLWFIYSYKCFPSVLCAKVTMKSSIEGDPIIWGYSVYKGVPGFRTLGQRFSFWAKANKADILEVFDNQAEMLTRLGKILTPKEPKETY